MTLLYCISWVPKSSSLFSYDLFRFSQISKEGCYNADSHEEHKVFSFFFLLYFPILMSCGYAWPSVKKAAVIVTPAESLLWNICC